MLNLTDRQGHVTFLFCCAYCKLLSHFKGYLKKVYGLPMLTTTTRLLKDPEYCQDPPSCLTYSWLYLSASHAKFMLQHGGECIYIFFFLHPPPPKPQTLLCIF